MFFPGGDMSDRFGFVNGIGLSYTYKHKSNFLFKLSGEYLFGTEVKETHLLDMLKTNTGYLIDGMGYLNPVSLNMQGFDFFLNAGKIIPWLGPNKNSGILLELGGGFLQHQIIFDYVSDEIVQIEGDYRKGYDRLTNGFALRQHLGYISFSNNNFLNWNFGIDFIEAFTKCRRDWSFDTMEKDDKSRLDLMIGITLQIKLPFYPKATETIYLF
jgi:hypothetical protein